MAGDDRVLMVHPNVKETKASPVEVSRHEFESVWKAVGWKLQPNTKKEK